MDSTPSGSNQANTAASRDVTQPTEHESGLPPVSWDWRKLDRAEAFQLATQAQMSAKRHRKRVAARGSLILAEPRAVNPDAVSLTFETASSKDGEARGPFYDCPYQKVFPTLGPFCGMPPGTKRVFGWHSINQVKQHLLEWHRIDHHCSNCWKVYKRVDAAASCHERTHCHVRERPPKVWLPDAPASQLRAERFSSRSIDAWYRIFDLVFPYLPEHGPEGYRAKFTPYYTLFDPHTTQVSPNGFVATEHYPRYGLDDLPLSQFSPRAFSYQSAPDSPPFHLASPLISHYASPLPGSPAFLGDKFDSEENADDKVADSGSDLVPLDHFLYLEPPDEDGVDSESITAIPVPLDVPPAFRAQKPGTEEHPDDNFTDSGYASVRRARRLSPGLPDEDGDDSDSKTVISAETTAIGVEAKRPLSEVCSDIYNQIKPHVNDSNRAAVLDALPNLIKAFAIRLAHHDPSITSRQIMHFVYTRHLEIASQLQRLLQPESEAEDTSRRGDKTGMSVAEKMLLWSHDPDEGDYPATPEDAFQGVEDLDDSVVHPEVSAYGRAILESKEYGWLIQRLVRESSFHWGPGPRIMVDELRHSIMAGLPTRISRKRDPCVHRVEFRFAWPQLRRRVWRERERMDGRMLPSVAATLVLIGTSDNSILVTSVGEYIDRTWGGNGRLLAKLDTILGRELGNSGATDYIGDDTTPFIPATQSVLVKGVSHPVAEQGEQLAWLVTALRDSGNQDFVHSRPWIAKRDAGVWEIWAESTPAPVVETEGLLALKQLNWFGNRVEPVLVQGFPTFCRPSRSFATPLEISPMTLTRLLTDSVQFLQLVKQNQHGCLWHATPTTKRGSCQCYPRGLGFQGDFFSYRHFVAICPGSRGSESRPGASPLSAVEAQSRDLDLMNTSSATPAGDFSQDSSPSCPETSLDSDMMSVPDSPEALLQDIPDRLSAVLDEVADQLLREYRNRPRRATLGPGEAHGGLELPPIDTAVAFATALVRTPPQGDTGDEHAGPCNTAGNGNPRTTSRPNRKRTACDKDESKDGDDGEGNMSPQKRQNRGDDSPDAKPLACPYLKLDPVQHRACLKLESFWEIKHVKQHLSRNHTAPDIHCSRCKTAFPKENQLEAHSQAVPACVPRRWPPGSHMLTSSQKTQLHKRLTGSSVPEKWFCIWHIVFPGRPQPESPYLEIEIAADLRGFREYAGGRGSVVLLERLRAAGLDISPSGEALESHVLTAVDRAVEAWIEDYIQSLRPAVNNRSSRPSRNTSSEASGRETIASSFVDSGVSVSGGNGVLPRVQVGASSAGPAMPRPRAGFGQGRAQWLQSTFGSGSLNTHLPAFPNRGADGIDIHNGAQLQGGHLNTNGGIWPSLAGNYVDAQGPPPLMGDLFGGSGMIPQNQALAGNGVVGQSQTLGPTHFGHNNQDVVAGFGGSHVSGIGELDGFESVIDSEQANNTFRDWDFLGVADANTGTIPHLPDPSALDSHFLDPSQLNFSFDDDT